MAVDDEGLRRRMKAAQALAGIKNIRELADRIDLPGLGRDTLYEMQSGKRPILRHELREIADACGVPVEFFTVDLAVLADITPQSDLDARMAQLEHSVQELADVIQTLILRLPVKRAPAEEDETGESEASVA